MKPLEFKIEEKGNMIFITFFFEKSESKSLILCSSNTKEELEAFLGLELNKHYSIADIYGYKVVDDRKGL